MNSRTRGRRILSRAFQGRPNVHKTIAFGSSYCVLKSCLRGQRGRRVQLMNCSLVSPGIQLLGRKCIRTLVTRHPRLRNCGKIGTLDQLLLFSRGPRIIGLLPVSVLLGRGCRFCGEMSGLLRV